MAANLSGSKSWLTYLRSWKLTGRLSRISQSHGFASVVVHRDTPAPHCTEKISYLRLHVRSSAASIVGYFRQGYNCHQIRTPCWGCAPSFNTGLSGHHTRSPQQPSYNIHYGRSKKSRVKIEKGLIVIFMLYPLAIIARPKLFQKSNFLLSGNRFQNSIFYHFTYDFKGHN